MPRISARSVSVVAVAVSLSAAAFAAPAAAAPAAAPPAAPAPAAPAPAAAACPDVQIVFARGSVELPGLGIVGTPFTEKLTAALPGKSVESYAVDYQAAISQQSAGAGGTDIARKVVEVAARCADTEFVLGGYSQGATATAIALGVPTQLGGVGEVIPTELAPRVKAIVTFGDPLGLENKTISGESPLYGDRARAYCTDGDPVCGGGLNLLAHLAYVVNSTIPQAVEFASQKVLA